MYRTGYESTVPLRRLEEIEAEPLERIELRLPGNRPWTGYARVGDDLRALPVGSHLEAETGLFTWQLGPGFLGTHELLFTSDERTIPLRVHIRGGRSERR